MSPTQTLYTGGDVSAGPRRLWVYLYPNSSAVDNECENAIAGALNDAASQLVAGGSQSAIDYYAISITYDHPNLNDNNRGNFFESFDGWLSSSPYNGIQGVHVGVADGFSGGFADAGDGSGYSAFSGASKTAVVGTGTIAEAFKSTAIQEVLHPCINKHLIDFLTDTGDEHELGLVYNDGSVSPMAAGYLPQSSDNGVCRSNNIWFYQAYSNELSSCTVQGVLETANDET